jgi:3-hydroxyisobutyrate dehydrogenase-like beta-hydroxyacid dehydrogenase
VTNVGFIGLGNQGAPMARRMVEGGFPLTIWARRPESLEPFADTAATAVSSPAEVGAASDVVGICVWSDDDVEDVLLRDDGVVAGMKPGGIIAVHSTIAPDNCIRLAERVAEHGITLLDAPVSGSATAAIAGELLLMIGGDPAALETCRPAFATYANPIVFLGGVGAAQTAKVINNLMLAAHMALAIEGFQLADALGVDLGGMAQVLAAGTGASKAAGIVAQSQFAYDYLKENSAKYFIKDLALMQEVVEAKGIPQPESILGVARHAFVAPEGS